MVLCMWLLAVDCCFKFAPKVLYIISRHGIGWTISSWMKQQRWQSLREKAFFFWSRSNKLAIVCFQKQSCISCAHRESNIVDAFYKSSAIHRKERLHKTCPGKRKRAEPTLVMLLLWPLSPSFSCSGKGRLSVFPSFPLRSSSSSSSSSWSGASVGNTHPLRLEGQSSSSHLEKTSTVKESRSLVEEDTTGKMVRSGLSWNFC